MVYNDIGGGGGITFYREVIRSGRIAMSKRKDLRMNWRSRWLETLDHLKDGKVKIIKPLSVNKKA